MNRGKGRGRTGGYTPGGRSSRNGPGSGYAHRGRHSGAWGTSHGATSGSMNQNWQKRSTDQMSVDTISTKTEDLKLHETSLEAGIESSKEDNLLSNSESSLKNKVSAKLDSKPDERTSIMESKTQLLFSKEENGGKKINDKITSSSGTTENVVTMSSDDPFDICPVKAEKMVNLKPPLHVKNRMKRDEDKRSAEGQSTIYLRPGMLLLKGYLRLDDQVRIVKLCRDLGLGHGGFYQPGYRDGSKLHLKMMCLGKNWDPQTSRYGVVRCDGAKPPPIPYELKQLVKDVILKSHTYLKENHKIYNAAQELPSMSPDLCIVNFYTKTGRLGLHQDKDESPKSIRQGLPVVSFSIGDTAEFLYSDSPDNIPEKLELKSGDVLIFGGKSRNVFHGVSSIKPDSTSKMLLEETNLRPGRLNLTFREF